jgi:hypothetical protein
VITVTPFVGENLGSVNPARPVLRSDMTVSKLTRDLALCQLALVDVAALRSRKVICSSTMRIYG